MPAGGDSFRTDDVGMWFMVLLTSEPDPGEFVGYEVWLDGNGDWVEKTGGRVLSDENRGVELVADSLSAGGEEDYALCRSAPGAGGHLWELIAIGSSAPAGTARGPGWVAGLTDDHCLSLTVLGASGRCSGIDTTQTLTLYWDGGGWTSDGVFVHEYGAGVVRFYLDEGVPKLTIDDHFLVWDAAGSLAGVHHIDFAGGGVDLCTDEDEDAEEAGSGSGSGFYPACDESTFRVRLTCTDQCGVESPCCPGVTIPRTICVTISAPGEEITTRTFLLGYEEANQRWIGCIYGLFPDNPDRGTTVVFYCEPTFEPTGFHLFTWAGGSCSGPDGNIVAWEFGGTPYSGSPVVTLESCDPLLVTGSWAGQFNGVGATFTVEFTVTADTTDCAGSGSGGGGGAEEFFDLGESVSVTFSNGTGDCTCLDTLTATLAQESATIWRNTPGDFDSSACPDGDATDNVGLSYVGDGWRLLGLYDGFDCVFVSQDAALRVVVIDVNATAGIGNSVCTGTFRCTFQGL